MAALQDVKVRPMNDILSHPALTLQASNLPFLHFSELDLPRGSVKDCQAGAVKFRRLNGPSDAQFRIHEGT